MPAEIDPIHTEEQSFHWPPGSRVNVDYSAVIGLMVCSIQRLYVPSYERFLSRTHPSDGFPPPARLGIIRATWLGRAAQDLQVLTTRRALASATAIFPPELPQSEWRPRACHKEETGFAELGLPEYGAARRHGTAARSVRWNAHPSMRGCSDGPAVVG